MKKLLFSLLLLSTVAACSDAPGAERVLADAGYTQIQTHGYSWFSCGRDNWATSFTAISPNGRKVSGAVCSGLLKGSTIRFD